MLPSRTPSESDRPDIPFANLLALAHSVGELSARVGHVEGVITTTHTDIAQLSEKVQAHRDATQERFDGIQRMLDAQNKESSDLLHLIQEQRASFGEIQPIIAYVEKERQRAEDRRGLTMEEHQRILGILPVVSALIVLLSLFLSDGRFHVSLGVHIAFLAGAALLLLLLGIYLLLRW